MNVFKPCTREGFHNIVLASSCFQAGITFDENTVLSSRICPACFRKACTYSKLFDFLATEINKPRQEETEETIVTKRAVISSPGRSPSRKSRKEDDQRSLEIPSARERPPASRRRLLLVQTVDDDQLGKENSQPCLQSGAESSNSNFLAHLNIDDLPDNTTSVKVLILSPNGNVTIRTPNDKATACLIKNLALKRWKAAANAFIVHEAMREDLLIALNRAVDKEFKDYCKSDTILKGRDVDELAAFSNKHVVKETEVNLPLWNACIRGSCGTDVEDDKDSTNTIALATATAARHRVRDLSTFHYRISTVLCHGGISFEGAVQLNKLGICMSPQQMVLLQRAMGKDHDAKILMWRKRVEENESACLLLQEVTAKQFPSLGDDDMDVVRIADLQPNSIHHYRFYSEKVMEVCLSEISSIQGRMDEELPTGDVISEALLALKQKDIPFYK